MEVWEVGAAGSPSPQAPKPPALVFARVSVPPTARRICRWYRVHLSSHDALREAARTQLGDCQIFADFSIEPADADGLGHLKPVP